MYLIDGTLYNLKKCHKCLVSRKGCEGGLEKLKSVETTSLPQASIESSSVSAAVTQGSKLKRGSEIDVNTETATIPKGKIPEVVIPVSRKQSALSQPTEDVPMASKLARTSHSSLLSHCLPSVGSSSSSQQVLNTALIGSFSPASLGPGMFGAWMLDPVLMCLNIFEETMRHNHEEGMH